MSFLLTTPVGEQAVEATINALSQPNQSPAVTEALLGTLRYAATWTKELLEPEMLLAMSELDHLIEHRDFILQSILEPCLYAAGESVTAAALARMARLYGEDGSSKYCFYYVNARKDFRPDARELAGSFCRERFSLHEAVAQKLGEGRPRILMAQNIKDRQGDEIIRCVPLIQALLDFNPELEITLATRRVYLYAHPRLTLIPIEDRDRVAALFQQRFDGVIDFFEPNAPEATHDPELEPLIQTYVERRQPFLFLGSTKGYNHFVYEQVSVDGRPLAASLGLDRRRVDNVYETTFRLIAELGLPLRCGEDAPASEPVLAGLPWSEAEAAWRALTRQNTERRPVALLNPFGGAEPLKGYVERKLAALAEVIRRLIAERIYVVLLPNGTPWGTAALAGEVIRRLEPHEQAQVAVAPDPAGGSDKVEHAIPGLPPLTHPDYVMRLVTYFIRFADLIVPVEGWMAHAAYCLGKPYRMLMAPYSHADEWHPYAGARHQQIALSLMQCVEEGRSDPLWLALPEQPRKFILLFLLREFGEARELKALGLLRQAASSEDRDLRQAAAISLGKLTGSEVEQDLIALLRDSFCGVRAAAATALLERPERAGEFRREQLMAFALIGREARDWMAVYQLGEAARPAVELALQDDDPVVSREAAQALRLLDFKATLRRTRPSLRERLIRNRVLRRLLGE
jgi:ADP-heptose:LPS heptosyltransferase